MALNLHHLRLFRAVARDGTLTGAARGLNLSASALSAQIRTLEAALGHDLFLRQGRGLVLTEAGQIALDHAEAIFRTADDLTGILRGTGDSAGPLRVGALATLSRNFQMQFLRPLIGTAGARVVLRSGSLSELLEALAALELDVVLTNSLPPSGGPEGYLLHPLADQPVSLIGPPVEWDADGQDGAGDLAAQLMRAPLILPTRGTGLRQAFDSLAARLGITPEIAAEVEDMAMIRLMVRAGGGQAIIPPIVVADELAQGSLREVSRLPGIHEVFHAVTLPRRFPNPWLARVLGP